MTPPADPSSEASIEALLAAIRSGADLLAYAYAMEAESAERYDELADQMAMHNNHEVAEAFRKLAGIEAQHAEELARRDEADPRAPRGPSSFRWLDPESPEAFPISEVHYLMTAHHALKVALYNERRAQAFYELLAERSPLPKVRDLARDFAAEEREHVALMQSWLERYPEPAVGWDVDDDAPHSQ